MDYAAVTALAPAWLGGPIFGAAAFDGTVVIDAALKAACSVSRENYQRNVEAAYESLAELVDHYRGDRPFPDLSGGTAIVVDDGLSVPLVTRVAIAAARNAGARRVVLALPTGHRYGVQQLMQSADLTYCASLRWTRSRCTENEPSASTGALLAPSGALCASAAALFASTGDIPPIGHPLVATPRSCCQTC